MFNLILITLGKALSSISLVLNLGSGSTWPGHMALKTNKHFIKQLLKGSHIKIILVAGTNGKTTTSSLLVHILKTAGKKVIQNNSGANLLNGIASTLLLHTNKKGKIDADYAIFEVDENSLPPLLKELTPESIILLNLFRDQLDRYGEVNSIVTHWTDALENLTEKTSLLLNADDPEIAYLGNKTKAHVAYFGITDTKLGQKTFQHASDSIYCPKCRAKLTYSTRFFSHLGIWSCPDCHIKQTKVTEIKPSSYPLSGIYNMYNIHAAVLQSQLLHIDENAIDESLKTFHPAFGRQETVKYYSKNVQLFLSKNPTSFNQSLRTIKELQGKYILLVLNDRIPDGRDVSWIWDTDIEEYVTSDMQVYLSGDRCYDLGLRLKYSETVPMDQLTIEPKLEEAILTAITNMPKEETLYILPTYSAMLETRKILTGREIL